MSEVETPATPKIMSAMTAVMRDVGSVGKNDRNSSQGFSFRGIDAVLNAVGPALRNHSVIVMPQVEDEKYETVLVGRNQTSMAHVRVKVRYRFVAEDGSWLDAVTVGEAMDSGDKAMTKAMSVAFRVALIQSLALPTDEPDPDLETYERSAPKPVQVEAKPEITEEALTEITASFAHAVSLEALEEAAKRAATFNLPDIKRNELKALYLEKKATLA